MSKRWFNAQIGFLTGSLLYFVFLWLAVVNEHYGWFRWEFDSQPRNYEIICTWGSMESFWYRTVSNAALSHRRQPHFLYATAVIFAFAFAWKQWPFRQDGEPAPRAKVFSGCLFGAVVLLNLWFSSANILPRYVRW